MPERAKESVMNLFESFRHRKDLLRHFGIMDIGPTSGTKTIATATDVFAEIAPTFNDHNFPTTKTSGMILKIHEMRRDATFREMFEWLAKSLGKNLESLCMTQNQIADLAYICPHWLVDSNRATIMLFKSKGQFCIAMMSAQKEEKFRMNFFILDYPVPWLGEFHHLVVVPKMNYPTK